MKGAGTCVRTALLPRVGSRGSQTMATWCECPGGVSMGLQKHKVGRSGKPSSRIRRSHLPGAQLAGEGRYFEEVSKQSRQIVQRPERK